ncbi:MAG TPA: DinB family protein [Vicinamibacterales bacterium]|nr:DinB family protein [Vicinamibacterales bacterium]
MGLAEKFVAEIDREMPPTRRLLERVPTDRGQWKPHPKSFALGHLAQLVSDMPGWLTRVARGEDIDLAGGPGYGFHPTETLLENFDRHVRESREALAEFKDEDYARPWNLRMGDKVLFTDERGMVLRQTINHFSHHRGQLTVYLRLLDVAVPSIYGPTADEGWKA